MAEEKKSRCELLKWNATALWEWTVSNKECDICRNHIMNICVECGNSKNEASNNQCNPVVGKCGCSFHFHCIQNWIKSNDKCPHHTQLKWEYIHKN